MLIANCSLLIVSICYIYTFYATDNENDAIFTFHFSLAAVDFGFNCGCRVVGCVFLGDLIMPIIVENITVSYRQLPAVHHLCAVFGEGEAWALCGPNGAGKSSLLKVIMGLEKTDTGKVIFDGLTHQDIAYLPQVSAIDRSQPLTVFELTAMGLWYEIGFFGGLSKQQKERVFNALERVGLENEANNLISQLSDGQFRRVLFARMLVQKAKFLLLDEPFNAIDEQTIEHLSEVLLGCLKAGQGIVAVLHDNRLVRKYFANTLLVAREKIAAGSTDEVLTIDNLNRAARFRQDQFDIDAWCEEETGVHQHHYHKH